MSLKVKAIAIVAGVAVFAAVSASAATLGGLKTDDLGANSNTVAGHLTGGAAVSFTSSYDSAVGYYKVSQVTVTPITGTESFGAGAALKLTLKGASNASLVEATGTGTATAGAPVTLAVAGTISANDIQGVSLVVNGGLVTAAVTGTK